MDGSSFFTVRLCCNDRYGGDVSACTCSFFNIDLESNVWLLSIRHYDCWLYSFYNTAWFCTAQCDLWWNRGDHRCAHVSEIGRASCRERVWIWVVDVVLKEKGRIVESD